MQILFWKKVLKKVKKLYKTLKGFVFKVVLYTFASNQKFMNY